MSRYHKVNRAQKKSKKRRKEEKKRRRKEPRDPEVVEGSVLEAPPHFCIAHCVSVCRKMGAGVALTLCRRYPSNRQYVLEEGEAGIGGVGVFTAPEDNRTIYNLQTKPTYRDKPTLDAVALALRHLRRAMRRRGHNHLAVPRLGCGRDRLDWEGQVLPLLKHVFRKSRVTIRVYEYVE